MWKKNLISISIGFCLITLQSYIEILKKCRKRAITVQIFFFKKLRKLFLDIHIRNVRQKLENSRLNGVAVITKTYTHTHMLPNLGYTLKKYFRSDWYFLIHSTNKTLQCYTIIHIYSILLPIYYPYPPIIYYKCS